MDGRKNVIIKYSKIVGGELIMVQAAPKYLTASLLFGRMI